MLRSPQLTLWAEMDERNPLCVAHDLPFGSAHDRRLCLRRAQVRNRRITTQEENRNCLLLLRPGDGAGGVGEGTRLCAQEW